VYFLIFYRAIRSYPALLGLFSEFYGPISLNFSLSSLWSLIFVFAFLVKLPIYFFHYWLPKAHVEAPSFGSIILAGLLLKLGG
jgi:NADH-quinone oxidoreductase subunit M